MRRQQEYLNIFLTYLSSISPASYDYFLERCREIDDRFENKHQIDVTAESIILRLAGDSTTAAPPPKVKKKGTDSK